MRGSTFLTLLGGAAIGVCITMYLMSERGHEMRERVGDWIEDGSDMIKDKYQRMRHAGGMFVDDIREDYKKAKADVCKDVEKVQKELASE